MIGGAQGSGVDTSANLFARAVAKAGYYIYGKREYFSNIKGRHSYFEMRIRDTPVNSLIDEKDILVSYDAETVLQHFYEVKSGGMLVYNSQEVNVKVSEVQSMEDGTKKRIENILKEKGFPLSVQGALMFAESNGVKLIPVNYDEAIRTVAKRLNETQLSKVTRFVNTIAVSTSAYLLGLDMRFMEEAVRETFGRKAEVVNQNMEAVKVGYDLVSSFEKYGKQLSPVEVRGHRVLLDGNTAIAIGKIAGGMRLQTYYPITPASDESVYIEGNQVIDLINGQKGGVVVVQTEDEISAVTMVNGAALAGVRAATATSGPGFSLMVEGMGYAGNVEIPIVITYYMRGGPSTGLPTRTSQADLLFPMFAGHGEFPRIVIASGDHVEAFYDAMKAFNYAERYQTPVVHLVDKALANAFVVTDESEFDPKKVKIDRGIIVDGNSGNGYKRFKITESGVSPRAFLGSKHIFWTTGDEHDEEGHITEDSEERLEMYEKRMRKLELASREIPEKEKFNYFGLENPDYIIYSWGSNKWAIVEAINKLNSEGYRFGFIQVRMFSPFPKNIEKIIRGKVVIDIETNYLGQAGIVLRQNTGLSPDHYILKWNGRPITESEIYNGVKQILEKKVEKVVVKGGA